MSANFIKEDDPISVIDMEGMKDKPAPNIYLTINSFDDDTMDGADE